MYIAYAVYSEPPEARREQIDQEAKTFRKKISREKWKSISGGRENDEEAAIRGFIELT